MSFKNVATILVILTIAGLASMAMSRDALLTVRKSLPVRCDATAKNAAGSDSIRRRDTVASVPKFKVGSLYRDEHARLDRESTETRCDRYGLKPHEGRPRRIFFGTMIADENWQVHLIHAIEVYDIYHVAVFVESNTTHVASPRPLRYKDSNEGDLLTHSALFGPKTQVYIDYWLEDRQDLKWMDRESEQRNPIVKRWKDAGMLPEDVGIMSDADEFFSRDFLRAVQTCDFPALRPDPSCHRPKIAPSTVAYESSPYCIKKTPWFHPDVISGQCVDGIGDPTERIVPLRTHKRRYGERHESYGRDDIDLYPEIVKKSDRYPLFTAPDIRRVQGDWGIPFSLKGIPGDETDTVHGIAYHLHNWFDDLKVLRNKYVTYAHGTLATKGKPLAHVTGDLDILVRCIKGIGNEANSGEYYLEGRKVKGPKPIFFLNETYSEERHKFVKEMVRRDEQKYGSAFKSKGKQNKK